jgi:hypothetical protein
LSGKETNWRLVGESCKCPTGLSREPEDAAAFDGTLAMTRPPRCSGSPDLSINRSAANSRN